jgi:hypothetical protein
MRDYRTCNPESGFGACFPVSDAAGFELETVHR